MNDNAGTSPKSVATIPPDDPDRNLAAARPDEDANLPHIGVVGDTYTLLITGDDTAGRYCLIDMYVPSGGGPPPHRHDFEEMFSVLEGEIEVTFRGEKSVARAGETVNIPANAPQRFRKPGAAVVFVFAVRAGEVFSGDGRPRCGPDDDAPEDGRDGSGGIQGEIGGACPEIPDGTSAAVGSLRRYFCSTPNRW